METNQPPADGPAAGGLGVIHLQRLWAKMINLRRGAAPVPDSNNGATNDVVVYDGLGLLIEETLRYLVQSAPAFSQFEQWILEKNGGTIEPERIDRINAITEGREYGPDTKRWLKEIEEMSPVLSTEDLAFFDQNGYVVVTNAVPLEQCRAAAQAIWEFIGKDPDDPDTWHAGTTGIFVPLYHHPALWANRRSRRIHKAYAQLWGTPDLWPLVDRVSMNPPERDAWKFPGPRLHWDMALVPPVGFGVQGILYLSDTASHQGAFTCVPGFHRNLDAWLRSLPASADPREQDLTNLRTVPVAGSAGDLIIFHQGVPHGGSPNRATRPRIAQFLDYHRPRRFAEAGSMRWR
jgi:hypothetical protein